MVNKNSRNVIHLGAAFFLIFFAFMSCSVIQVTVISHSSSYNFGNLKSTDGYTSLSLIYGAFTIGNFLAAPIVNGIGVRLALPVAAINYAAFEIGFFFLNRIYLFVSSIILGLSAAVLWTAQGKYITQNCDGNTARHYSSIFYALYKISSITGGIFLLVVFNFVDSGTNMISLMTVRILYGVFSAVTVSGVVMLAFLKPANYSKSNVEKEKATQETRNKETRSYFENFVATFKLAATKEMILMAIVFGNNGIALGFSTSIYPTCIASTQRLGYNTKSLLAISTIVNGIAQVTCAALVLKLSPKIGRAKVACIGFALHLLAYVGIFLNFPNNSSLELTNDSAWIEPSITVMLLCSFVLGTGDAFWNVQITSSIITHYSNQSAEAFSLTHFYTSLMSCVIFYCSRTYPLYFHLTILTIVFTLAFACFCVAEMLHDKKLQLNESQKS